MKKVPALLLVFTCFSFGLCAQVEDAWVYLTDKKNVTASLNNPISILTQPPLIEKTAMELLLMPVMFLLMKLI